MKKNTYKMLLFFLFFFSVFFTNAQDVTISGSCFVGTQTFVLGGDPDVLTYNNKPAYYNANMSVNYQSSTITAVAYLVFMPAAELGLPEDRWVVLLDGQPYFYAISSAATAPTSNYLPFEETAATTDCGGTPVVAPPNQAPTDILLSNASINENVDPLTTTIGTFSTTDPDAGETFTYSLVLGAGSDNNAAFSIVGNVLKINSSPNYEIKASYTIRVRTTDHGGAFFEKNFLITINNLCDVVLLKTETDETCPGANNGSAIVTAIEGQGPYTYTWAHGPTIDRIFNLAPGTYTVTVRDAIGCPATQTINIGTTPDVTRPVPSLLMLPPVIRECGDLTIIPPPTAFDNCRGFITAITTDPVVYSTVGAYTIHWIYNDGNGNSYTQQQTVQVFDSQKPVPNVEALPNIVSQCEITAGTIVAPTATDNCSGSIVGTTTDPLTYSAQGIYVINWTYTDAYGNTSNQIQNVIVKDTTDPVFDLANLPNIVSQCEITAGTIVAPTATDNCSGSIVGATIDPLTYSSQGDYVIMWTYTDAYGNTSNQIQNVIVKDTTDPVFDLANLPNIVSQCEITAGTIVAPTATDNCKGVVTGTTTDPVTYSAQGEYTITWTYDDENGNTSTQTQKVIVKDNIAPVADVTNLPDVVAQCEIVAGSISAPTAIDNCKGSVIGKTTDPVTYSALGEYTITWTYDDENGNTSTQKQKVIVKDNIAPVADLTNLPDVVAQCEIVAGSISAPTAIDNCKGSIIGKTTDPVTYSALGEYTITWTYDDENGNTLTQTQKVIVKDNIAPVADVTNLSDVVAQCGVTVIAPTAMDNCKGVVTGTTADPLTYSSQGEYTITWTYDDENGNTSTQKQKVIVKDNIAPVADVTNLSDVVAQCAVTVIAPTAMDNCKGVVTGTTTDPLTYSAQGEYTITWTYDDENGNTSTQKQKVIVKDNIAPVADVTNLPDVLAQCNIITGTISAPTATDNCKGSVIGKTTDPLTYSSQGEYTITWTYDDENGNTSTQKQKVIVKDNIAPVADVTNLSDVVAQCGVTVIAPTAMDNCKGVVTGTTTDPVTYFTQGEYTITWTYDDENGNTSTQKQKVIVKDNIAPVVDVTNLPDVLAQCNIITGTISAPTATDNCKGSVIGKTTDPLTYSSQGEYTITWTYDDENGNTSTQKQKVIVKDNISPVVDVTNLPDVLAQCNIITGTISAPTATDNCKGSVIGKTTDPLTYSSQGEYTITWTYDDENGNTSTQKQKVIVKDNIAPVVDVTNLPDVLAQCDIITGTISAPTATDNCKGSIIGTTTDPLTYSAQGEYTITWTYDDENGNTSTQTQKVIVKDNIAPVVDVTNLPDVLAQCDIITGTISAPTATDNCKGVVTGKTTDPLTYSSQGNFTITWTYDDENGNTSTQTQKVIVKDNIAPVADVTNLPNVEAQCGITTGMITAPTATDDCAGTITGTTTNPLTYSAPGNYTITWTYADGNGNTSTQQQLVVVTASALESVTFTDASYTFDGNLHTLEVQNLPAGAQVTYTKSSVSGTSNGETNAGTYEITATVSPSLGNCTPIILSATLEIKKATQQITFEALAEKILGSNSFNLNAVSSSGLPVNYSFTYSSVLPAANVSVGGLVDLLRGGEILITAQQDGNNNYLPAEEVSQLLIIKDNKATIGEITIGGKVYQDPSNEINYLMECGEDNVAISIKNDVNASINPSENFIVDVPKAGIYKQNIAVTSEDGSVTSNYVVNIEKPFKFSDIVHQKFNNVLLVNNNPQTNGGYEFVSYEWFKNGQLVGTGQYYSAGDSVTDELDPSANYMVKMKTKNGQVLQTCNSSISTQRSLTAKLYPNPIQTGKVVTIETDFPSEELERMQINLYTVSGQLIKTVKSSSVRTEIQLPIADSTMYLVVIETPNIKKTLKVIVNK